MALPRDTEKAVDPHIAQWVVRAVTRIFASYSVIIGLAIIAGGVARFAGLSYAVALSLPGAPTTWGVIAVLAGLVALAGTILGRAGMTAAGILTSALWSLLFASAFAVAALRYPEASSTAMWVYLFTSAVLFVLGSAHLSMWKDRKK